MVFVLNSKHFDDITERIEFAAQKGVKKLKLRFGTSFLGIGPPYKYEAIDVFAYSPERFVYGGRVHVRVRDKVIEGFFSSSSFFETVSLIGSELVPKLGIISAKLKYLNLRSCDSLQHLNITAPHVDLATLGLSDNCNMKCFSNGDVVCLHQALE